MGESLASETLDFEIQTDILTLLENVKCQGNNPSGLKQALLALANICSDNSASQEYFYQTGGVDELQTLLLQGCCPLSAVPAALYCLACAVRQNVTSQKAVSTERMFSLIHELLSNSNSSERLIQSTAFLLACSVAGSNKGQLLADETGCLQDLVNLLRDVMASGSEDESTWSSIVRAIGVCVNNPQNAHNQQICCSMLPHILKLINTESRHKCVGHVLTLISSVVANNVPNQNRIRRCGGIEMLINFIRHQVRVEITKPQSMNVLVNAVSAVDACIADNEECGVQAGTLGLVQMLLDLLQIKDLELSHMQVFILALAHVLESSNEFCRLVNGGRGYYTLVNYLTECQDEELFKAIKYILTLCKMQGTHELSDAKQHNDVHDEDYEGDHERSKRDLTAFLKEGLSALSNQLSSIEKISEGIQWMTNVNMTAQPVDGFMPHMGTPGRHSYTDHMPPNYTHAEKTGSLNIVKWARQDSLPSENSLKDNRECQGQETTRNASFVSDIRKSSDNETRQVFQNSSLGNSIHTKCNRFIMPQDARAEMIKLSGVDSNCKRIQDIGTNTQMKPHHGSSTQVQKSYDLACSNAHVAYIGKSGDPEHLNCYQGKHANPITDSDISQIHRQKHWNTKQDNNFQIHKDGRPYYLSKEMLNSNCLEEQISYQKHSYQEVDCGNTDISPCSVKETRRQHLTGDLQFPYEQEMTMCPQVQDSGNGKHLVTDCSPNHMGMGQQNCHTGDSVQSPLSDQQPCKHHRKINVVAHKHSETDYALKAQSSMCCERLYDRPKTVKCGDGMQRPVFDQQPFKHHEKINAEAHTHNESDYVQKAQCSNCCEGSCDRPVHPCFSVSSPRNTYSSSKLSSSHIHVPHLPALQITPESESHTEQNLEANKVGNCKPKDSFRTCMSPHENQLHLLSQLQRVVSNFFRSLYPGQADLSKQWKPTDRTSPAAQPSGEQYQNSSEMIGSPSSLCKSILSVCEEGNLLDKDQHQEMFQTCLSTTKQTLTDQTSKLENNNITLHKENGSRPEIQKYDSIQAMPTSSSCKIGCSLRNNIVHYDNGGGRIVKTSASNKAVDEDKIFLKPSQPCLPASRTVVNHKAAIAVSNTRLASTPSTPITFHTSKRTPLPANHQPPVSPALSLFDSQLRSMAYRGTTDVASVRRHSVSQKSDDSTSGFESTCTAEAITNVASARPSSESKADGKTCERSPALNELQSAGLPTSQLPISTIQKNCPLHHDNVKSQSTHRSFCNQISHAQSQYTTNTVGNKRKSATCFKKRIHKKKKADLAGCGPQYSKCSSCPGCGIGLNLNSCTYNIAIEASPYTCTYHRHIRQCERMYITQLLMSKRTLSDPKKGCKDGMGTATTATHDVYDFQSGSEEFKELPSIRRPATSRKNNRKTGRRPRVAYTEQEVLNVLEGVHRMGKHWQQILWTYQFHSSRTAVDLKDKYKQLQAKQAGQTTKQLPFSLCEIRRLKNGVKHLGYNWQAILRSYKFLPGRTAADLHTQWRSLNRVESLSDGVDS